MKPASLITFLLLLTSSAFGQTGLVRWEPATLINGSPCVFRVRLPANLSSLRGMWQGKTVYFSFDQTSATWQGLAGIDLDTKPGSQQLSLEAVSAAGQRTVYGQDIPVAKGIYRVTALSVPKKFIEPDQETLLRIQQEKGLKDQAFSLTTPERLWSGRFAAPARSITTGVFGSQRTFNGVRQSVHQGLDYRASTGTPITAISDGRVILARDFFFEGNFLVIDHGQGLLSLYMHLSAFKVKEGDRVSKGQLVALSGGTGRSTGPHLHLGVRWQGVYVDPAILLRLSLSQ
jgi:murein DD-endopeptidase MepM/ murein hydrolase activator NlpD